MKNGKPVIWILLIFMIIIGIRFIHLSADPPYDLSSSGGPYGDPAGYSLNARNKVLFENWEIDNYNMMYSSYPAHLATYIVFRFLGVGIVQQNLVPVLFSSGVLVLFFLILSMRFGRRTALWGTGLLGLNYLFLMYSRVANRIMPPLFFILLGIFLLSRSKKISLCHLAAGASFSLALLSKSVIFYALGAVLLGYFLFLVFNYDLRSILKRILYIFSGSMIPLLPWLIWIYLPHRDFIDAFSRINIQYLIPPLDPALLIKYFWTRPALIVRNMPLTALLAAAGGLVLLERTIRSGRRIPFTDWIFLSWFSVGWLYYALIQQRVTRHYIPQIIPLIFLAVFLLFNLLKKEDFQGDRKPGILFIFSSAIWVIFPVSLCLKYLYSRFPGIFSQQWILNVLLLGVSIAAAWIIIRIFHRFPAGYRHIRSVPVRRAAAAGFLLLIFAIQLTPYVKWSTNPPTQIRDISRDYGRAFESAVIAGLWAPAICLENGHRGHEYFRRLINYEKDFFEKFNITHIFTTTAFRENRIFEEDFPHIMERSRLLARYHIWTTQALLYKVGPSADSGDPSRFEAEVYTQKGSTPRYDQDASQKFSVFSPGKTPGFAVIGTPEDKFEAGTYDVCFRIKKSESGQKDLPGARIDVITGKNHRILASQELSADDLSSREYFPFVLKIHLHKARRITFRIYNRGCGLWIDNIEIRQQ